MQRPILPLATAIAIQLVLFGDAIPCFAARDCLVNGNFERIDASGMPIGWRRTEGPKEQLLLSDDRIAFSGKRSVKILPKVDGAAFLAATNRLHAG